MHTVTADDGCVAGAVPALRVECLCGGFGQVEVAVEDGRSLNLQSPNGFAVMCTGGAVVVAQPGRHTLQPHPPPARASFTVCAGAEGYQGFAGAVPLDGWVAGDLGEF